VRRDRPRVSKPPWAVTTLSRRCSRQTPAYRTDLPSAVQDADSHSQYVEAIKPVVRRALSWAALSSGFHTLLMDARRKSPMVKDVATIPIRPNNFPSDVGDQVEEATPAPTGPSNWQWLKKDFCDFRRSLPNWLQTCSVLQRACMNGKALWDALKRRLRARPAHDRIPSLEDKDQLLIDTPMHPEDTTI